LAATAFATAGFAPVTGAVFDAIALGFPASAGACGRAGGGSASSAGSAGASSGSSVVEGAGAGTTDGSDLAFAKSGVGAGAVLGAAGDVEATDEVASPPLDRAR
jgi:hypothetical protein